MEDQKKAILKKERYGIQDLIQIMQILRGEGGCPWDRVQTHESIRTAVIEEAYETAEAIDCGSADMMCEELGDLLLQVVFHAAIGQDEGTYDFDDICDGICRKMIVRHPHVFSDGRADNAEQVLDRWDQIKAQTKGQATLRQTLDGVCTAFPALIRAAKFAKKANKAGQYDIPDVGLLHPDAAEIGKKLFEIAAYAASCGIDAEDALQKYCAEFKNKYE